VLENLPIALDVLAGQDLTELETKALENEKQLKASLKKADSATDADAFHKNQLVREEGKANTAERTSVRKDSGRSASPARPVLMFPDEDQDGEEHEGDDGLLDAEIDLDNMPASIADEDLGLRSDAGDDGVSQASSDSDSDSEYRPQEDSVAGSGYDNDTVVLGLRVYTRKDAPAVVGGQLRHPRQTSLAALVDSAL